MRPLLFLLLLLAPAAALAQPAVRVGDQVRVEQRPDGRLVGLALEVGADTLVLADPVTGEPVPVFFGDVRSLEVRRTRSRSRDTLRGALIGGAIGAIPSVAFFVSDQFGAWGGFGLYGVIYFAPAIPLGAGIGAAVGGIGPTDWWERVPTGYVSAQPFAVAEGGGGVRLVIGL